MSYTREQWVRAVLHYIGNDFPSQETVNFGVAWTVGETYGPGGGGRNNLLNTEQKGFGADNARISDFPTFHQGTKANAHALENGYYPQILHALRNNDVHALLYNAEVAREIEHVWGTSTFHPSTVASQVRSGRLPRTQSFPEGTPQRGDIPTRETTEAAKPKKRTRSGVR